MYLLGFLTFFNSEKPILFRTLHILFVMCGADLFRIPYERPALDEHFHSKRRLFLQRKRGNYIPGIQTPPTGVVMPLSDTKISWHNQDA